MSRRRLRDAVGSRNARAAAVVPLIGRHAARLEQVPEAAFLSDPEVQARALRNAQALYGTDAVTVGAALDTVAMAVRAASPPGTPLEALPDHDAVLSQAPLQAELEAMRRLRPVLGERAGVALVLPAPDRLAGQLGDAAALDWCAGLLMRLVRLFGAEEPELLITVGASDPGPRLGAVCDHFGVAHVHLGAAAPDGVVAVAGGEFAEAADGGRGIGWLYTTSDEIPAEADPGRVRDAVARMHS